MGVTAVRAGRRAPHQGRGCLSPIGGGGTAKRGSASGGGVGESA